MKKNVLGLTAFFAILLITTAIFNVPASIATALLILMFLRISYTYKLKPVYVCVLSMISFTACEKKIQNVEEQLAKQEIKTAQIDSIAIKARIAVENAKRDSLAAVAKKDSLAKLAKVMPIDTVPSRPVVWPQLPEPLPGSILPHNRIIAFYGNPLSKLMGILGEIPHEQMLAKLDQEVEAWRKADPSTPVMPALHVIMVTAQGAPGRDSKYRLRMKDQLAEEVIAWAAKRNAIVFVDIQIGHSSLQDELPRLANLLSRPNVHLGIDAEFAMKAGAVPGKSMGVFDAADINYASSFLANLVDQHQIPPKVFVVHRFTQKMITNYQNIKLDPKVQIVMHMDGWGAPTLKKDTYRRYIVREPVQYTGFKLFYKNDIRNGSRLMTPEEVLSLNPKPLYIQYQ